jgi:ribosomal 50S subunit-recycling heat shock protein
VIRLKDNEQLNEDIRSDLPELREEDSSVIGLTAGADDAGARLDAFIGWNTDELSRSYAVRLIEKGRVTVNGKAVTSKKSTLNEGDEVVIFSSARGNTLEDMAAVLGTISYEIMTSVAARVKRIYVRE